MQRTQHQLSESQTSKLTNWKNEPTLQQLKQDFEAAKPSHDAHVSRVRHWLDLMEVKGSAKPPKVEGRSSVQPKLIRRQAEWRYSALTEPFLGSNKLFSVKPVTFEDDEGAKQNELVINWQFRTKLNRVKFIDDFVRSTVDEGTCVVRLGWKRVTKTIHEEVPVYDHFEIQTEEQLQQFQQALEMKQADPRSYEEQAPAELKAAIDFYEESQRATYAIEKGTEKVPVEKVIENRPTLEVLNHENVYIDPSCQGDIDKALFAMVSFETNKAELLKEGKRYKNLDRVNWEGNSPLATPDHATSTPNDFNFSDSARKKVVAIEWWGFYDIHGDGTLVPIVATWIGNVLIRMELNPFPDQKLPFVVVPYLPVKRELFGEPDAELLEDNQKILGAVSRGMIDLLGRSANAQQGFAKGMLDPINKRKFDKGQDYEFNPNVPPAAGHINHTYPEFPQSAMSMLQLQNMEAEALTGVKSFAGGMSGDAYGEVAAGIRGVLDAASKREMAILRRLAKGMMEIGMKIISMNSLFLSAEEVIRVTNNEFVTVKREDLQGNFDLEVDIATAEVDNQKSQDLSFILQTLGPKADPAIYMMILAEICDLKRMPALAHKLRNYQPQPSPAEQEMQQLAIEKAKLENKELESKIELNQAKAQEARSNKDLKDLEYVETETGTKHARDMEKQRGQAEGNQDLEVTKAFLKTRKQANGGETKPEIEKAVGWNQLSSALDNRGRPEPVDNMTERDELAEQDPRYSIHSKFYDPSLDPSANPNINLS